MDAFEIKKKYGTASRVLRDRGALGFVSAAREWKAVRGKYVQFDGCTFTLDVDDQDVKIRLVRKQYEEFERRAVQQHILTDLPVVELGGCIGVVACVTSKVLREGISHVAVEANPCEIPIIETNRELNRCEFEIVNAAIAYDRPTVTFCPSLSLDSNSLRDDSGSNAVTVDAISLRDIVNRKYIGSFTLICDIEGHEYELVQHELDVLRRAETIILDTHAGIIGEAKNAELLEKLKEVGFKKIDEEASVLVLKRFG